MYENIGKKIKILAQVILGLGISSCVILGLYICFATKEFNAYGLLCILIGSISSLIITWLIYGFGELIERVSSIDKKASTYSNLGLVGQQVANIENKKENENINTNVRRNVVHRWRCSNCNKMISEDVCPYCGHVH